MNIFSKIVSAFLKIMLAIFILFAVVLLLNKTWGGGIFFTCASILTYLGIAKTKNKVLTAILIPSLLFLMVYAITIDYRYTPPTSTEHLKVSAEQQEAKSQSENINAVANEQITEIMSNVEETQEHVEENATIDFDRFDMEITLKKLYDEYTSNSVRANQTYLNKRLKITAPIYKFETVENGLISILVGMAKEDKNVKSKWNKITLKQKNVNCLASFDFEIGDDTGILDYNVGDNITIIGTLTSTGTVTLFFRNCKIVK